MTYVAEEIVITLTYSIDSDREMEFHYIKKLMLDYHLDLSCTHKMLFRRGHRTNEDINENGMTTWNNTRAEYTGVFIVDSVFFCLDKNGLVSHKLDALA